MNRYELLAKLVNEGYVAQQYCVLSIGLAQQDGLVLEQNDEGRFAIFVYERGQRGDSLLVSDSEHEICDHYYSLVSQAPFVLLMSNSKSAAQQVQALLTLQKIESKLQTLPVSIFGVAKYQVIVNGGDLGRARYALLFSIEALPKKWWQIWN